MPSFARSGFVVTEADGRTAYLFDAQGRHLQTFDADTGVVTLTVAHDDEGRLLSLTDRDGLVTTIARDAAGTPMEIVGPYSHRTALGLDDNGYLNRIEDPEGGAWIADYDDLGLMLSWTNRNGHQKTLTWDSGGLLQSVTDAALATTTLTAVSTAAGRAVTLESALGRTPHLRPRAGGGTERGARQHGAQRPDHNVYPHRRGDHLGHLPGRHRHLDHPRPPTLASGWRRPTWPSTSSPS
ncbi:MAG: hypothetical protein IPM79_36725 [Polyangiaceae bacterium]|nr:hypothetical protein [Polyangiaceae bacterium]